LTPWQQAQAGLSEEQLALQKEQLAYQQEQARQEAFTDQMREAYRLEALGAEGWIERALAEQAKWKPQVRWDKEGFRNPYAAYLRTYQPERLNELVALGFASEKMLLPLDTYSKFGEPYPKPEEGERPGELIERPTYPEYFTKDTLPTKRWVAENPQAGTPGWLGASTKGTTTKITIKPGGETVVSSAPVPGGETIPPYEDVKDEFITKTKPRVINKKPGIPTPGWLANITPWLSTGQDISKGQLPTPSGQWWTQAMPDVLGGLKGFTKWGGAGRSFEDIYSHMRQMQPEGVWGGKGRWKPATQRV